MQKGNRFTSQGYRDSWAALIWLLQLGVVVGLAIYAVSSKKYEHPYQWASNNSTSIPHTNTAPSDNNTNCTLDWNAGRTTTVISLFSASVLGSAILGIAWLFLMVSYPLQLLKILVVLYVILMGTLILLTLLVNPLLGIIPALFFLIFLFVIYRARSRFEFSAIILQMAAKSVKSHPATIFVTIVMLIACFVYQVIWVIATMTATALWQLIPLLFCSLWTQGVFIAISHTTTAGTAATDYFVGDTPSPVYGAFKRACTYSLGSICFGTAIVAALKTVRIILRIARQQARENGNIALMIILCCAECLLSWIESLIEYFNQYAFVQIAIYGKSFREAASDTWKLVQSCGVDAILNDMVINIAMNMATLAGSLVLGVGVGIAAGLASKDWWSSSCGSSLAFGIIMGVIAFIFAALIHNLFFSVIDSSVMTFFVCYAEEPQVLRARDPQLYNLIVEKQMAGGITAGLDPESYSQAPSNYQPSQQYTPVYGQPYGQQYGQTNYPPQYNQQPQGYQYTKPY